MPEKEKVLELLEKISNQNDEILALLKTNKPEAEIKDASQPDPPGTGDDG
jgi:hypothetical protein